MNRQHITHVNRELNQINNELTTFQPINENNFNNEEEQEDDEPESSKFPYPLEEDTIHRTSMNKNLEQNKKDGWKLIKENLEEKKNNDKKWLKVVKSVQNNTKSFLGVESLNATAQTHSNSSNLKTLNNWNERTFKILKSNPIFGGEIKQDRLEAYINDLDENNVDEANPFLYYKESGGSQVDLRPKISVANMTVNGLKRLIKRKKPGDRDIKYMDPALDFEHPQVLYSSEMPEDPRIPNRRYHGVDRVDNASQEDNVEGPCDAFTHAFTGRRVLGVGFCGRLCDNDLDKDKKNQYDDLLKSIKQHRPYFTYWITFVQVIICFVSIFAYGLAPIGFSYELKKGLATTINLEKQLISYKVKQNFWIGPAPMDLVHLGAKYAPCMRNDSNIFKAIRNDIEMEKESACCIRNDRGGCVQTNKEKCSELMSQWHKWNTSSMGMPVINGIERSSGSVCGLDPRFCADSMVNSNKWPDDITQWPICDKPTALVNTSQKDYEHMYCEIIGRPCCVGIQGECLITTLEHCDLMRGYFHAEAHLCSQVDCMQEVCGMIDFLNSKSPDQVYRLFTSIFIHAGIIQLLVTVFFQIFILRDVEKLAGCLRVAIVYTASGVIGNLGSAIFLPYQAEVGPLGCQFGIIACLFVEMFHAWDIYKHPWLVFLKLFSCLFVLFLIGFLPMIDNFANLFGFLAGLLLGSILFPNINLKGKCRRAIIISVCVSITIVIVSALIVLFYIKPIETCDACKFLSCPFGSNYCLEMDFNITRIKN